MCYPGYIIKDEGISICMSSKHLQTRRLLSTLQAFLLEIRSMLIQLWREANERPEAFIDHHGIMRDARTGKPIQLEEAEEGGGEDEEMREYNPDGLVILILNLSFSWRLRIL